MKTTLTQFLIPLARAARAGGRPPNSGSGSPSDPIQDHPGWASRVADAGCRWRTNKAHRASSVAAWAGVLFLLLCGSFTGAWAQTVMSEPNQIKGTIKWINDPAGPVFAHLNTAANGFYSAEIYASELGGGSFSAYTAFLTDPASYISTPYLITVQGGSPGISYNVTPRANLSRGDYYIFAPATSPGVLPEPAPDVTLDFFECAGLIDVKFCDAANNPVTVSGGGFYVDIPATGARQAGGTFDRPRSNWRLAVRSGSTLSLNGGAYVQYGTDPFTDYFSLGYVNNFTLTVGCDEIVPIKFIVAPDPLGSGGGAGTLGKIVGNVDMLREHEHWFDHVSTLMHAEDGPLGNYRLDSVEPTSLGGPSSGPFSLNNLLPSNFSTPPRDYWVFGELIFGLNRRFEWFRTPFLEANNLRVNVPPNTTVDLGDTFVIDPGYVVGAIFLCGPDEGDQGNSCLRSIAHGSDFDSDHDGIPDSIVPYYTSYLFAFGRPVLATGATKTAYGGVGLVDFEGDFVNSGPNKNHFVGDYRLALGGLNQETTRWDQSGLTLKFTHNTPEVPDAYINCALSILNRQFEDVEIVPNRTLVNNHRYGTSQVTIRFKATSGTLFYPAVVGNGTFSGVNFEGQPAQYNVNVAYGFGAPISLATATSDGQVRVCIPEGTYTFYPTVESVNPGGTSSSHNTLPRVNVTVGPCEFVEVTPGLVLNVNTIPECVAQPQLTLSGSVNSAAAVASITYTLNGHTVTVCNNCGLNPAFNFTLILADCDNALQITATDVNGLVSSRSKTIHFDGTPPVLSGCLNRTINIQPGELGAAVNFTVTATDNCDGALSVTCVPASGSFLLAGETPVICRATDECGNTGTCAFTVTVTAVDRTPPTIHCPGDISTATDPRQCSAVVTFTATASDDRSGVTFACAPPSGSTFSKGTTTVICTATDAAGNTAQCSFVVTVNDHEAPTAGCIPTVNPAGGNIPNAGVGQGSSPRSGQNPDGFYELQGTDNCGAAGVSIYVKDASEGPCGGAFMAGPYAPGTKVKLTQSPGQRSVRPMAGVIVAHINTIGEPVVVVMDASGNTAVCTRCFVPPLPK